MLAFGASVAVFTAGSYPVGTLGCRAVQAGEVIHLAAISIVCKRLRLCESFYVGFWRVLPFLRLGLIPLARCRASLGGHSFGCYFHCLLAFAPL